MESAALTFFQQILETPSPSGFEAELQKKVHAHAEAFADEVSTDLHGNLIAVKNPGAPVRVMMAGHCDQFGERRPAWNAGQSTMMLFSNTLSRPPWL